MLIVPWKKTINLNLTCVLSVAAMRPFGNDSACCSACCSVCCSVCLQRVLQCVLRPQSHIAQDIVLQCCSACSALCNTQSMLQCVLQYVLRPHAQSIAHGTWHLVPHRAHARTILQSYTNNLKGAYIKRHMSRRSHFFLLFYERVMSQMWTSHALFTGLIEMDWRVHRSKNDESNIEFVRHVIHVNESVPRKNESHAICEAHQSTTSAGFF